MKENFINLSRMAWLVAIAVLVPVVGVAVSVLYMVVYGHLIDPGHERPYYDAHIQFAGPYIGVVAGIPLMFIAGWLVSRWWESKFVIESVWVVWFAYAVIDIAVLLAFGAPLGAAIFVAISLITKLAAVYAGARFGSRIHHTLKPR